MNNKLTYTNNFFRLSGLLTESEVKVLEEGYVKDNSFDPRKDDVIDVDGVKIEPSVSLGADGFIMVSFGNYKGDDGNVGRYDLNNIGLKGINYLLSRIYDIIVYTILLNNHKVKTQRELFNQDVKKQLKGFKFEPFKSQKDKERQVDDIKDNQRAKLYRRFIEQIFGSKFSFSADDSNIYVSFPQPIELGDKGTEELVDVLINDYGAEIDKSRLK